MNPADRELFVVATPIGNLEDITYRAVRTLKECGLILAEDTRVTRILLSRYEIHTPVQSFNAFQEGDQRRLEHAFAQHSKISLVTDAGTPCISDPGERAVNWCHENSIRVTPIPGASALTTALSASGFPVKDALFLGFLPNKKGRRKNLLLAALQNEKKTLVFYESPYRFHHFLQICAEFSPDLQICLCRELTKKFEQIERKTAKAWLEIFENLTMKGEIVLVVHNAENHSELSSFDGDGR